MVRIICFLQLLAFRKHYFKDYWNLLDLFIIILSAVDIVLDIVAAGSMGGFSPGVLKVAKIFRVLRMGRVLKLMKVRKIISLLMINATLLCAIEESPTFKKLVSQNSVIDFLC